jgi:2',3'-cyclic-nucleotide 2'-phosphodiesterase (5'-nucleotidase family)
MLTLPVRPVFLSSSDVHAHLDSYRASGTDCPGAEDPSVPCLGGYSRILAEVNEIRASVKDSLMINCGDEFQGTLFFSYYGSKVISQTLNLLNYSVSTHLLLMPAFLW